MLMLMKGLHDMNKSKTWKFVCLECGCMFDKIIKDTNMQPSIECPMCGYIKVPDRTKVWGDID